MDVYDREDSSITQHNNTVNNNTNQQNNNQINMKSSLDQLSPYYFRPTENHGKILVSPPLSENNYESWNRSMKHTLLSKTKIKFINGKFTATLEDDALFDTWEKYATTLFFHGSRHLYLLIFLKVPFMSIMLLNFGQMFTTIFSRVIIFDYLIYLSKSFHEIR